MTMTGLSNDGATLIAAPVLVISLALVGIVVRRIQARVERKKEIFPDASFSVGELGSDWDKPIKPRTGEGFSSQMDGTSIRITYTDRMGTRTKRTITLNRLRYDQYGCSVIPTHIEAYCSLRQDRRTFFVRSIDEAFDGWNEIKSLHSFLIQHARIPRGEAGSTASSRTRAKLKKVLLDDPRIMVFCGYKNPDRNPTPYTLRLSSMKEATVSEEKDGEIVETTTIRTITGWDTEANQTRTVSYARIVSACDPDTGEIIEDLASHLRSFRMKTGKG
ncbi:hypothetical protein [Bombella pollinis]|uniref:WYL domain-containing protein n=1 Tax=Bombella pollinis TaxID=2967337 RepID=A0ABT3WLV8_9PROT|nr:hypothetical protein [Bombella pollinis]MCX5620109.1 hypothetical protein [Bombella pollinis]